MPRFEHPGFLTFLLWMTFPLLALNVFVAAWSFSSGDALGFDAFVHHVTGYDALAARRATHWGHHVAAVVLTGLMIGMIGTDPGHELTHRTWDPASMLVGRWLLAFSFDTAFAIEHLYGHHRYVSTVEDPAAAPRGRNVYFHIVASTIKGNLSAWHIETKRLEREGHGALSPSNAVIRGYMMSAVLAALVYATRGWKAAGYVCAAALWGNALLEIVNYMER